MRIEIPIDLAAFARSVGAFTTPKRRQSGFADKDASTRGRGDYLDLLGSLVVFWQFGVAGVVSRIELTSGAGDEADVRLRYQNTWTTVNVKTSEFAPFNDHLHLYVKEEEIAKPMDVYLQVFVHVGEEGDEAPHVHLAGWTTTQRPPWTRYAGKLVEIPNTGGHRGVAIPVSELRPFTGLLALGDKKF